MPITILTTILYTSKIYIFLNHNTGTILVYNTGTNFYTSIVHNTSIPVLRSPSTGDPFYTTNPVFYTSGNRFIRRTGTFENLTFSLVPSDNRNTRSTCPTSVFTGIGQTLMSRPVDVVI